MECRSICGVLVSDSHAINSKFYSCGFFMYLGCILAELYTGFAILPGEDESDQVRSLKGWINLKIF